MYIQPIAQGEMSWEENENGVWLYEKTKDSLPTRLNRLQLNQTNNKLSSKW